MISDYVKLAIGNLKKRGLRSWLTMLGIFIGIAAVVSLISLGNSLQSAITGQFSSLDPNKLTIQNKGTGFGPPGSTVVKKLNNRDLEIIENIQGVQYAIPRLIRIVNVNFNDKSEFFYVASIPKEKEKIDVVNDAANLEIEEGKLLEQGDRKKVVLGNGFKDKNIFDKEIRVNKKIKIQGKEFEVVGFLKKSSSFQLNNVILMPEEDLKDILNIEDEYDIIVVQVKDMNEAPIVKERIEKALRKDRNLKEGEEDFSVQTPQQALQTINTILSVINIVVAGIAAISLIVGGIGIANTMYTSVLERTKEIGIMKAVGAKNSDILSIFIIESALLGFVGGIIGVIMGLGLAYLVSFSITSVFPSISFQINPSISLIILAVLFSLFIGLVSGTLPAIQASKLKPVDALRK